MDNYNMHWKKRGEIVVDLLLSENIVIYCIFSLPLQNISVQTELNLKLKVCRYTKKMSSVFFCSSCPSPITPLKLKGVADSSFKPYSSILTAVSHNHCTSHKHTLLIPELHVYWSKQNDSQDSHVEVVCDWLR